MSRLPKLAIVGRPNVGKSALFNCIVKKKIAIVDEAEGVTRDRLYAMADLFGRPFEAIDTGGIHAKSKALFNEEIKRQAEIAIEEADTLVLVVDAKVGLTDLDADLARLLLRTKKPLCLAINKIDGPSQISLVHQFYSLGIKKNIPVSATQNWHIAELLEAAFEPLPKEEVESADHSVIHLAIVGRPNVGKSSLVNYLLDDQRCIVSPIPGTTRDSVDIKFTHGEDTYNLIDTAGIRRKHAEHEVVDKFAAIRTERAIERADVCLLLLDAQEGMTMQEKRIAHDIEQSGKACVLAFNKWDLVKGFRMEHCLREVQEDVPFLKHCPKLFMSAMTGRNIDKLFPLIKKVYDDSQMRITTHQLNKFISAAMQKNHPPMINGKRLRIYYMAQVDVQPPRFILFVNYPSLMLDSYKKYLINQLREEFGFEGVPLEVHMKGKEKTKKPESRKPEALVKPSHEEEDYADEHDDEDDWDEGDFDDSYRNNFEVK